MNKYQKQRFAESHLAEQMFLSIKENIEEIERLQQRPVEEIMVRILEEVKNINKKLNELEFYIKNHHA